MCSQLPIYGEPKQTEYVLVPPESTPFSRGVTSFRKSLWAFLDNFKVRICDLRSKEGGEGGLTFAPRMCFCSCLLNPWLFLF